MSVVKYRDPETGQWIKVGMPKVEGSVVKKVSNVIVLSSGWLDETETTALWRYRITNSNIEDNMSVDVNFSVTDYTEDEASSLVRATNSGVLAATTSGVGYVDIYATSQPDSNLSCELVLTTVKEV